MSKNLIIMSRVRKIIELFQGSTRELFEPFSTVQLFVAYPELEVLHLTGR